MKELTSLNDIVDAPYNPRAIGDHELAGLKKSLHLYGDISGIVWNARTGHLVTGHQRMRSLKEQYGDRLTLKTDGPAPRVETPDGQIFIIRIVDWDDPTERAANIAANSPDIQGHFDTEKLAAMLKNMKARGLPLDATALSGKFINGLLREKPSGQDGTNVSPGAILREKHQTALGQIWALGEHRIACGDCRDKALLARLFGTRRANAMWTDPPYGVSYEGKTADALTIENDGSEDLPALLKKAFAAADSVMLEGAPFYIAHPAGALSFEFLKAVRDVGWLHHETLVWVKDAMVLGHSDYHYKHEPVLYGWKRGGNRPWYGGRNQVSVAEVERPKVSAEYPTSKPVRLIESHLVNSTTRGDVVFEPFLGSGSTLIAAENLRLVCLGTELSPDYLAVVIERWAKHTGAVPELIDAPERS